MSAKERAGAEILELRKKVEELRRELRTYEDQLAMKERSIGRGGVSPERGEAAGDRENEHLLLMRSRQVAVGDMIGSMAHQWRQPLTAISLLIQDLGECYTYGEFSKEYLDTTVRNAVGMVQNLSHMIDDLRGFFRQDGGAMNFSIEESLERTLAFIESSLRYGNITVERVVEEDLTVSGCPNEFCQVLLTIIGYFKRVFRERETVEPVLRIRAFREGDRAVVTIRENSGGIPESLAHRISRPDFSSGDEENVTALGLYLARTIVEREMGGRMTVATEEGGACFRIEI
jgi:signal transduction histidine kinase